MLRYLSSPPRGIGLIVTPGDWQWFVEKGADELYCHSEVLLATGITRRRHGSG